MIRDCNGIGLFTAVATGAVRQMSHEVKETDEEFDARYIAFFSRPDIDGWEVRKVSWFSSSKN